MPLEAARRSRRAPDGIQGASLILALQVKTRISLTAVSIGETLVSGLF
jgi:hypothetical protein